VTALLAATVAKRRPEAKRVPTGSKRERTMSKRNGSRVEIGGRYMDGNRDAPTAICRVSGERISDVFDGSSLDIDV
jgi:hypothetical protein